jgi:hypothetical protein
VAEDLTRVCSGGKYRCGPQTGNSFFLGSSPMTRSRNTGRDHICLKWRKWEATVVLTFLPSTPLLVQQNREDIGDGFPWREDPSSPD